MHRVRRGFAPIVAVFCSLLAVAGCSETSSGVGGGLSAMKSMVLPSSFSSHAYRASDRERECLARAMFFESNRSSRDGLVAVGSVVMNRRDSGKWGDDVCDVVGAKRQFAPGVMTRPMNSKALPDVMAAADAVLKGERHPKVHKDVMFFHTAGLKFPYKNMHYTTVAGGNAFYEKRSRRPENLPVQDAIEPTVMVAENGPLPTPTQVEVSRVRVAAPQPVEQTQIAFAGDTPTQKPVRTSLFGRKKVEPAVELPQPVAPTEVALADEAPIPTDPVELAEPVKPKKRQARAQQPASDEVIVPVEAVSAKPVRKQRPAPVEAVVASADQPTYEAPSAERFGGAAFADSGLSEGDGTGTGVLGRLVVKGN